MRASTGSHPVTTWLTSSPRTERGAVLLFYRATAPRPPPHPPLRARSRRSLCAQPRPYSQEQVAALTDGVGDPIDTGVSTGGTRWMPRGVTPRRLMPSPVRQYLIRTPTERGGPRQELLALAFDSVRFVQSRIIWFDDRQHGRCFISAVALLPCCFSQYVVVPEAADSLIDRRL